MATQEKTWNVANRLHSLKDSDNPEVNHIIAGADEIYDDTKGAKQSDINAQTDVALAERYTKSETYNKEQLDSLITTPDANYVTVATFADLPQTGEANTVYRVSFYDGTQVDASKYALYAWNGKTYQLLAVRSAVGEVFDVSEYNSGATYETLAAALAAVPESVWKGGMSIKFVQSSDNKYVQYMLTSDTFTTNVNDWVECNSNTVEGKIFYVTDNNGNIIAKIDKDGVHSVDFKIGEEGDSVANALRNIATQISNAVAEEENRAKAVEATKLDAVLSDNAFYFTDANGYIIVKIDNEGIHAPNLSEGGEVNSDNITIQDKNGYIVARIDKDGIHSAKDKHAVACMVLSESYYPTAAPTRDSDGNVTYAQVMFETGVAGSISITYTNGNSSSVAVVYGDYNYTITINRDADGNVETVNVQ